MDDIDMNSFNSKNEDEKTNQEEDSCVALDNIQKKLKIITDTFTNSLEHIKNYAPFIEKGTEQNMEKEQHNFRNLENYDENRKNFDETLTSLGNQMNEHFESILEMTRNLKNFEEFNMSEAQLKEKLNNLKEQNQRANEEMNKKLKNIETIFNSLNSNNIMENDINNRESLDDNIDM